MTLILKYFANNSVHCGFAKTLLQKYLKNSPYFFLQTSYQFILYDPGLILFVVIFSYDAAINMFKII